ncbi:hypothetical protein G6L40_16855 [Rhizobium lusitanum]|nr:hypothetical protein [Rhizobium lusitanum]
MVPLPAEPARSLEGRRLRILSIRRANARVWEPWLRSGINDLGYIDLERRTLQTIDNRFGTRSSPMQRVTCISF